MWKKCCVFNFSFLNVEEAGIPQTGKKNWAKLVWVWKKHGSVQNEREGKKGVGQPPKIGQTLMQKMD